ncbi:Aldo/keto reductase [[Mycoplasma] cavipharyngis]|uniref:aldo/keto reductase family protein n=1 Tax=[Mycoplasma] cavipharyngis TaxID=92757 RepID=UPI0037049630
MDQTNKSLLGYGTYLIKNQNIETWVQLLETAYLAKYDYIDTAKLYQNETEIGHALEVLKAKYGLNFNFKIQTKIWPKNYPKARQAVLDSLKKLKVKQLDSVLLHWPSPDFAQDLLAWEALIQLQKEGYIKSIGVSNYPANMLSFFSAVTNHSPKFNQIQYSLYNQKYNLADFEALKIHLQAWRPLTDSIPDLSNDQVLVKIAKELQTDPTAIAISFVKSQNLDVIVKSVNLQRIEKNAQAYHQIDLNQSQIVKLKAIKRQNKNFVFWKPFNQPLNDQTISRLKKRMLILNKRNNSIFYWFYYPIYYALIVFYASLERVKSFFN